MTLLEQIKAKHGDRFVALHVPEWDCEVRAKRLGAVEYIRLVGRFPGKVEGAAALDYLTAVVQWSLVNEDGEQLIGDDDLYLLTDAPGMTMSLGNRLLKVNGLGGDDSKNSSGSQP